MGKFTGLKSRNTGIGEVIDAPRACCRCGGEWNIPVPVKGMDNKNHPHPGGDGWCWRCYETQRQLDLTPPFRARIFR